MKSPMVTRRRFLKLTAAGMAAASAGGLLGACKRSKDEEAAGRQPDDELVIGSKNFQEQRILAALIAELIERKAEAEATTREHETTFACHEALIAGGIQAYVEYTGTAYAAVLKHYPDTDPDRVYAQVKKQYADEFGIHWLPPLGFENKYAILVRKESAEEHGLAKIGDLTKAQDELTPGFVFEFYDRADGYRGLVDTYELSFAREPVQMKRMGEMYRALLDGEVDVIAGNSTDGKIAAHDLVMLEDDRQYFPPYYAAPLIRADTAERHPQVKDVLASLAGKIDVEAMRRANHAVDNEGQTPQAAATALLSDIGLA